MTEEKFYEDVLKKEDHSNKRQIVVWNDDVNTFEWVITSLIEVCNHHKEQAEQCALIVHNNGKCDVKSGSYDELKPLATELLNRQINTTIE